MSTSRKSTTKRYDSPFVDVPQVGKCIRYDALTRDYSSFFNGNFLGSRRRRDEAEALADEAALAEARLEGMLAGQLIAANAAAMECYRRAMLHEQTLEGRKENLNQANKLSRTYVTLLEALNRHRGKGIQQKVTVEHVHVHAGGQAVVGAVQGGGGAADGNQRQPHAQGLAHASVTPLRSSNPELEPVPVTGDREMLERVVINLADNAVKFTRDGGRVTLTLSSSRAEAVLEVADTGIGVPAHEQQRLFDRFFRSSLAEHHAIPGSGLGLSIARNIVARHGGTIEVDSEPGRGSVFRVRLPVS